MAILYGIHAVEEALASGRPLERLLIASGPAREQGRVERLVVAARSARLPVRFVPREELDRLTGTRDHQRVAAVVGAQRYTELEDLLAKAGSPPLYVLLDGVEDPHNLGAILRTAHSTGADGVILPERRAAGVTPAVEKVAAGATQHLRVARVTNLGRALEELKQTGCWLVGLEERAATELSQVDFTGPTGVVLGGEGKGLHEHIRKKCDFLASIPTVGRIRSLNVSVAAGIVLYEALRQRRAKGLVSR